MWYCYVALLYYIMGNEGNVVVYSSRPSLAPDPWNGVRGRYSSCHHGYLLPRGLKVRWSVTWANVGVPSNDVPAEVDLLHMRVESHAFVLKLRILIVANLSRNIWVYIIITMQRGSTARRHILQIDQWQLLEERLFTNIALTRHFNLGMLHNLRII